MIFNQLYVCNKYEVTITPPQHFTNTDIVEVKIIKRGFKRMTRTIKRIEEVVKGSKTIITIYQVEQYFCEKTTKEWVDMVKEKKCEYTIDYPDNKEEFNNV